MPPKTYTVLCRKLTEMEARQESFDGLDKAIQYAALQIDNEADNAMFGYEVRIIVTH